MDRRRGASFVDVLMVVCVAVLVTSLCAPLILKVRGYARQNSCQRRLGTIAMALRSYHDVHQSLPPAAVWDTNATSSIALHLSRRVDRITRQNWVQMLLPLLDEEELADSFDPRRAIGHDGNEAARTTALAAMTCPADSYNHSGNLYHFYPRQAGDSYVEFARGNYAINGGTHNWEIHPRSTAKPRGDVPTLVMDSDSRQYAHWGNGVAGINRSFGFDDFTNGQSTLVAVEELRAGIHHIDPRGVWSLGQIGGSITWGHGVNGDAGSPNNQWPRSDDVLGCGTLHDKLGLAEIMAARMPCVHYVDGNNQATSRSMHDAGVNVAMVDGSVKFVSDNVDPGLWYTMHSRETPATVLEDFDARLDIFEFSKDAVGPHSGSGLGRIVAAPSTEQPLVNSVDMEFVQVAPGEFTMGLADTGNNHELPDECPAHTVVITRSFQLGRHEVTRGQYARVMGSPPAAERDTSVASGVEAESGDSSGPPESADSLPVVNVTWEEAAEFCRKLSNSPDEQSAGRSYRLPTEAEWEYACRSGSAEPYVWSSKRTRDDVSGDTAGILPALPLAPVGAFPPNSFGLFDMRRNAWEWCDDWYDRDYYARSPVEDPQGPDSGYLKVVRGGDWTFIGEMCRINYPMLPPWKASPFVGFRVVCETVNP